MPAATGEIYQVIYQFEQAANTVENVLHFREMNGLSTPANLRAAAEAWWTLQRLVCSNSCNLLQMTIKQMTPVQFDQDIALPVGSSIGNINSPPVNSQVSQVLTLRTGVAGKRHRGRMYLPAPPSSMTNTYERGPTAPYIALLATFCTDAITQFGPAGTNAYLRLGVYSRTIGGSSPYTLAGWQQVTVINTGSVFGAQRRRRYGVGI